MNVRNPVTGQLMPQPAESRFWSKVDRREPGECWPWTAATTRGYGNLLVNGVSRPAHRFAYELLVGPIPAGLVIDHLCRNRSCCNPAHMEPVTNGENVLRGVGWAARAARATHCPQGHEYSAANTYRDRANSRHCRRCDPARVKRFAEAHPERRAAYRAANIDRIRAHDRERKRAAYHAEKLEAHRD